MEVKILMEPIYLKRESLLFSTSPEASMPGVWGKFRVTPGFPIHEPSVYILIIYLDNLYRFLNYYVLQAFDNILLDL